MKKIGMIAVMLVLAVAAASARDKIVSADQLPKAAKDFIAANFAGLTVQYVEKDFNEYEVQLVAGSESTGMDSVSGATVASSVEIKFKGNGDWESVKSYGGIPAGILPAAVTSYISSNYADAKVVEVEKDWNRIEVKLSNRMELYFDKNGKFLGQKFDD